MSSFSDPHAMYLFETKSGKRKLSWGRSPEDALAILAERLGAEEMQDVLGDRYVKVHQRDLQSYVSLLG